MPVVDDLPEVCGRVPDMNLVIDGLALLIVAVTGLVVSGISWSFIIQLLVVIQISDFVPCTWQGIKYLSSDKIMFTKLVGNLFLEFSSSSRSYVPAGHMIVHASDPMWLLCHCRFSCKWRLHPLNFWDAACGTKFFVEFLFPNCSGNCKWWVLLLGTFCWWRW